METVFLWFLSLDSSMPEVSRSAGLLKRNLQCRWHRYFCFFWHSFQD